LFLNFEQKGTSCFYKIVLIKNKKSIIFRENQAFSGKKRVSIYKVFTLRHADPKPPNRGTLETFQKCHMLIPALVVCIFYEHMGWRQFFIILRRSFRNKSKIL